VFFTFCFIFSYRQKCWRGIQVQRCSYWMSSWTCTMGLMMTSGYNDAEHACWISSHAKILSPYLFVQEPTLLRYETLQRWHISLWVFAFCKRKFVLIILSSICELSKIGHHHMNQGMFVCLFGYASTSLTCITIKCLSEV